MLHLVLLCISVLASLSVGITRYVSVTSESSASLEYDGRMLDITVSLLHHVLFLISLRLCQIISRSRGTEMRAAPAALCVDTKRHCTRVSERECVARGGMDRE